MTGKLLNSNAAKDNCNEANEKPIVKMIDFKSSIGCSKESMLNLPRSAGKKYWRHERFSENLSWILTNQKLIPNPALH